MPEAGGLPAPLRHLLVHQPRALGRDPRESVGRSARTHWRVAAPRVLIRRVGSRADITSLTVHLVFSYRHLWQVLPPATLLGMGTTVAQSLPGRPWHSLVFTSPVFLCVLSFLIFFLFLFF